MLRLLLALSIALLTTGCSTISTVSALGTAYYAYTKLPKAADAKASAASAPAAAAPAQVVATAARVPTALPAVTNADQATATLAQSAAMHVSLRTKSLAERPTTVAMLKHLCTKGISTEVVIPGSSREDSVALNNSCVRVYVSKAPHLANTPDVLLVDMNKMYAQGVPTPAAAFLAQDEYETRQVLKREALRSN